MTAVDIILIAAILGLGATLQSAVGFGMALAGVPLLVWAGHPLPVAVALLLGGALVQTAHGTYVTREHIRWRLALPFAAIQWLALGGGVMGMQRLSDADPAVMKQGVGAIVIIVMTAQLIVRPRPRERLAAVWTAVAASTAGLLAGLVGMNGPPLVFYALAHTWNRDRFRGFLWSQFLLVLPVLIVALAIRFGGQLLESVAIGVALAPILWLGSKLGIATTRRWDRKRLQLAAVIMLYLIGAAGVLGPYL